MFSSFPPRWEKLDPHEASQSGQGRGSSTGISHRDHGGEGGAGLHDRLTVKYGSSIKVHIVDRDIIPAKDEVDTKISWDVQLVSYENKPPRNSRGTCARSV